jgi:cytochrome P450
LKDSFYNPVVPDHVPPELVHDFNIYDVGGGDPFLAYRALQDAGLPDIFWTRNNEGHWIILRNEPIAEIMRNDVVFSNTRPIVPDSANLTEVRFIPLHADPPQHGRYRAQIAPMLTPKVVKQLEIKLSELTERLIDDVLEKGEFDFMAEFACKMPIIVLLEFLGFPLEDREHLLDIANRVVEPDPGEHRDGPVNELFAYLSDKIAERTANPGEDLISQIILREPQGGGTFSDKEMLWLITSVVLGGLETVASSLGFSARWLATHPAERQRLIDQPELIPNAVEEILRRFPVSTPGREVMQDTTLRGVDMKAGEHVIWSLGMYNFDEQLFKNAMTVDLDRPRTQHATFGVGVHFCVGAFLARTELKMFMNRWLKRIPEFHIPAGTNYNYRVGLTISLKDLPMKLGPAPESEIAKAA